MPSGRSFLRLLLFVRMSAPKLFAIDSLRGLAAMQVIAFHLATMPNSHLATAPWTRPFIEHGNSGVTLFFLISAFTLGLSMKTRSGEKHPLLSFWMRRLFRIFPLFLFWLSWMLFRYRHDHIPLWPDIISNLT